MVQLNHVAQLVQFELRQFTCIANPQTVEGQARESNALQLLNFVTQRFEHAVNLTLLAFVDRQRDPRVPTFRWQLCDFSWHRDRAVVEPHAGA
jgi:hypothetical protein